MNNTSVKNTKEPLFHIVKNASLPSWAAWCIRGGAIVLSLVLASIICALFGETSPFTVLGSLFEGAFGSERRIWILIQDTCLLLMVALALLPSFRMKFWNLGGNGQILVSCIVCCACMKFMPAAGVAEWLTVLIMIPLSILASIVWAVVPAIFKAFFNTNESLFTLMLNYVAEGLVLFFVNSWVKDGTAVLVPIETANLPELGNRYVLIILMAVIALAFMFVYFRYSKHGYEISVVGESENTAKYIGINVKKVIIRTLILSGAVCGIVGLLLAGGINHTMDSNSHSNMGFTAIMAAWIGQFNPLFVFFTSFFITFVNKGMGQVRQSCNFTNTAISDIVIGLVFFFVIACEFFINYKIVFKKKVKTESQQDSASEVVIETENENVENVVSDNSDDEIEENSAVVAEEKE